MRSSGAGSRRSTRRSLTRGNAGTRCRVRRGPYLLPRVAGEREPEFGSPPSISNAARLPSIYPASQSCPAWRARAIAMQ
jgi:hypothetical protein